MKVLFIGNSHTFFNDMPAMFRDICESYGVETDVTMLCCPGVGYDYHVRNFEARFNILYGDYDYVIMQHCAHPMGDLEVMHESGLRLIDWVDSARAIPVLFQTWAKKADGAAFQPTMSGEYQKLADDSDAIIAPVGDAWWKFIEMNPDIDIFYKDGEHANVIGSRLAAFTFAATILDVDPEELALYADGEYDELIAKAYMAVAKDDYQDFDSYIAELYASKQ